MPSWYHLETTGRRARPLQDGTTESPCSHLDAEADVETRYDGTDTEELRAVVDELERELAACRERVEERERRSGAFESALDERRGFPDGVHEEMRAVGTDARSAVVSVGTPDSRGAYRGTGWVVEDGTVVTASAVLAGPSGESLGGWTGPVPDGPDSVTLESVGGDELPVERTVVDGGSPVGTVEAETEGLDALPTGSAADLAEGDPLLVVGHVARVGQWVSSLGRYAGGEGETAFRIDGPVSHAATAHPTAVPPIAGAPVLDGEGRAVGLVEGHRPRTEEPKPGTFSRAEEVFQGLPDVHDLVAVDASAVADRVGTSARVDGPAPDGGGGP